MSYVSTLRALLALTLIAIPAGTAFAQAEDGSEVAPRGVAFAPLLDMTGMYSPDGAIDMPWAQASTAGDVESTWTFVGAFYLHMVDISGRQIIGPIQLDLDVGFSDLFDKLDGAFSGHFEGHNGNFGFGIDYVWVKVGEEGIELGPEGAPGVIPIEGAASMTTSAFEAFGTYRIGDQEGQVRMDQDPGAQIPLINGELPNGDYRSAVSDS